MCSVEVPHSLKTQNKHRFIGTSLIQFILALTEFLRHECCEFSNSVHGNKLKIETIQSYRKTKREITFDFDQTMQILGPSDTLKFDQNSDAISMHYKYRPPYEWLGVDTYKLVRHTFHVYINIY